MTFFSIPVSVGLASESQWDTLDERKCAFGIVRFHFYLEDYATDSPVCYGEPIGVYKKPKGVTIKRTTSETTVIQSVVSQKSIENFLLERKELNELATEILTKAGFMAAIGFSGSIKAKIKEKLTQSITLGQEIRASTKVTTTETVQIENEIPEDFEETLLSVPAYVRRETRIHLAYIDHLKVLYKHTALGLRKRARSEPPIIDFRNHPNKVEVGQHIATAYYWEFKPKSSCFVMEKEHRNDVLNPLEIQVCEPPVNRPKRVDFPKVPTLYQLARAAFPRKWIWRKSPTKEWTEEELMAIELEDVKGKGGWWQRNGANA